MEVNEVLHGQLLNHVTNQNIDRISTKAVCPLWQKNLSTELENNRKIENEAPIVATEKKFQ